MNYRRLQPEAARGHMPFAGHRTCEEVRHDQERTRLLARIGRDDSERTQRRKLRVG